MPLLTATLRAKPSVGLTRRVAGTLADATAGILGKERERTSVVVNYVPAAQWSRGGVPVEGAFCVEARVTAGTNDGEQKSAFVRKVNDQLEALLRGPGYVIVSEIPAESWGYAGETQAARYSKAFA